MKSYTELTEAIAALQGDAEKFFIKGNNAAGTRLRKGLQSVKKIASTIRQEVTNAKKVAKNSSETGQN